MKTTKRILALLLSLIVLLGVAGCGSKKEEAKASFTPALDTETRTKIKVAGNYSNFEALEAEFTRFNKIYPNVELSYVLLTDFNNTITTALDGADAPDIYVTLTWMKGREKYDAVFAHAENLADPALKLNLSCIRPGILSTGEDGTLSMLPVFSNPHGMLVNNSLFEKEGLAVPTTYSELQSVCAAFREKGYASPIMGYANADNSYVLYHAVYPYFCSTLADKPDTVTALNNLDASAGEALRPALEAASRLLTDGCIDLAACAAIENNYNAVIMTFFNGDVPMMICTGDTVSGTQKREAQSENFSKNPFTYTFVPLPVTEEGGYFLDSPSLEFSVNKMSGNLDMANEFMRFLISSEELNAMAAAKRLVTTTNDLSFDSVYAPFGAVPAERTVSPESIGITDDAVKQLRKALYAIGTGAMTIDEAVANYGQF